MVGWAVEVGAAVMERQAEFERWRRKRLPEITEEQRAVMTAIELACGRPLSLVGFRMVAGGKRWRRVASGADWRSKLDGAKAVRCLVRRGLMEVVGLGRAVYRVTRLGRLTRGLRG